MADVAALEAVAARREGSNPFARTKKREILLKVGLTPK
jgi:hypothetical protein